MTDTSSAVQVWLSSALGGSLISQMAQSRGIELEDLPEGAQSDQLNSLLQELKTSGIDPELVAEHAALSLACLFVQAENAKAIINAFTDVLWSVLGDPTRNGDQPPEIYRKAGFAMHIALVGFFDPSITERVFNS